MDLDCHRLICHPCYLFELVCPRIPWYGRVERARSLSRNVLTWPRVYSHCQGSPTHCLLVAGVLFAKLRGRKANVRRFNRVGGQRKSISYNVLRCFSYKKYISILQKDRVYLIGSIENLLYFV